MNDRLIGDFLEINADIIYQRQISKLPKLFSNMKAKYYHKKLIKRVNRLKKSNYILTRDNLSELFSYIYNNFPPYGSYKSILTSKINNEDATQVEGVILFGSTELKSYTNIYSYKAVISIDNEINKMDVMVNLQKGDDYENLFFEIDKLYSENNKTSEILEILNKQLLDDLTDYILSVISLYNK